MKPTVNLIKAISFKYSYEFQSHDGTQPDTDLTFWVTKNYVFKASNNDWDGIMNPGEYIQNHGNYSITPRPESTTTLHTPYNIQARFIMADNLESHIANLNDISLSVQFLNTDVHILQSEINQIEVQIGKMVQFMELCHLTLKQCKSQ
jgi:hypothetical protein